MRMRYIAPLILGPLLATPRIAAAHVLGPEAGIVAGLVHPLTGPDHLLMLLAAGFYAQRLGHGVRWRVPLGVMCALLGGALAGALGGPAATLEPLVWASAAVMTWMGVRAPVLDWRRGASFAGAVGLLHGYVHGGELHFHHGLAGFLTGMLASSALLLAFGMALAAAPPVREIQAKLASLLGRVHVAGDRA